MFSKCTEWKLALNRFTEAQREYAKMGREVFDLTISNPTRAGLQYKPQAILESLADPKIFDYDPQPKGLASAREAVAAYYLEKLVSVNSESLMLTTSTSEGYSYVFR